MPFFKSFFCPWPKKADVWSLPLIICNGMIILAIFSGSMTRHLTNEFWGCKDKSWLVTYFFQQERWYLILLAWRFDMEWTRRDKRSLSWLSSIHEMCFLKFFHAVSVVISCSLPHAMSGCLGTSPCKHQTHLLLWYRGPEELRQI